MIFKGEIPRPLSKINRRATDSAPRDVPPFEKAFNDTRLRRSDSTPGIRNWVRRSGCSLCTESLKRALSQRRGRNEVFKMNPHMLTPLTFVCNVSGDNIAEKHIL